MKTFVILGGSSGIGLASAQLLASQGARVIISSRSEDKLKEAKDQITGHVDFHVCDISDKNQTKALFADVGTINGIVCTAGQTPPGAVSALSTSDAQKGFQSKFWGQYFAVKYGSPKLAQDGAIVLFSGVFSVKPALNTAVLAAVNGAVESFVRAMALELAPIRINAIAPGFVDTPRLGRVSGANKEEFAHKVATQVPLKKVGQPSDIAQSVLYLLTNPFTTGSTLYVDGGMTLR